MNNLKDIHNSAKISLPLERVVYQDFNEQFIGNG